MFFFLVFILLFFVSFYSFFFLQKFMHKFLQEFILGFSIIFWDIIKGVPNLEHKSSSRTLAHPYRGFFQEILLRIIPWIPATEFKRNSSCDVSRNSSGYTVEIYLGILPHISPVIPKRITPKIYPDPVLKNLQSFLLFLQGFL